MSYMSGGFNNDVFEIGGFRGGGFFGGGFGVSTGEPPPPMETLFFLNTPPRQPNTRYILLSDGIIESEKVVIG